MVSASLAQGDENYRSYSLKVEIKETVNHKEFESVLKEAVETSDSIPSRNSIQEFQGFI